MGRAARAARKYVAELVYGSNDGLITTFAIVAGVAGASLSERVVLILGTASLLADGFSMGASDYLSERSKPDEPATRGQAGKRGTATFAGFVVVGVVPLLAYVAPVPTNAKFAVAGAMTVMALFAVGAARAVASEGVSWLRGGLEMLIVGSVTAGIAWGIGVATSGLADGMAV